VLGDGTELVLREIRPADKHLLQEGLGHLSFESRYHRFFTPKRKLSASELRYFTELDGRDHLAIVAVVGGRHEDEGAVAVARCIRLSDLPDTAEAAIVVTDEFQHRGLGELLFRRLMMAAAKNAIRNLRCVVLAENRGMQRLLKRVAPGAKTRLDGHVVMVEFPVDSE
jgi:GNAT superfamily N-acetyltransferase